VPSHKGDAAPIQSELFEDQPWADEGAPEKEPSPPAAAKPENPEKRYGQVRQLIKQALERPTAEGIADFLDFGVRFRRLGACLSNRRN
jgi:hypothetical protein